MIFNRFLTLLIVALVFSSCQKVKDEQTVDVDLAINSDLLKLDQDKGIVYYKDEVFSGTAVTMLENETKSESIEYLNGKKHGLYQKWFNTGTIGFQSEYFNGKKEGKTSTWWKNGNLRSVSFFEDGIANGEQIQWYKSGAMFKKRKLINGKELGMQQSWRENGKLYNNYEAKNGRIFGLKKATLCYELEDENVK